MGGVMQSCFHFFCDCRDFAACLSSERNIGNAEPQGRQGMTWPVTAIEDRPKPDFGPCGGGIRDDIRKPLRSGIARGTRRT